MKNPRISSPRQNVTSQQRKKKRGKKPKEERKKERRVKKQRRKKSRKADPEKRKRFKNVTIENNSVSSSGLRDNQPPWVQLEGIINPSQKPNNTIEAIPNKPTKMKTKKKPRPNNIVQSSMSENQLSNKDYISGNAMNNDRESPSTERHKEVDNAVLNMPVQNVPQYGEQKSALENERTTESALLTAFSVPDHKYIGHSKTSNEGSVHVTTEELVDDETIITTTGSTLPDQGNNIDKDKILNSFGISDTYKTLLQTNNLNDFTKDTILSISKPKDIENNEELERNIKFTFHHRISSASNTEMNNHQANTESSNAIFDSKVTSNTLTQQLERHKLVLSTNTPEDHMVTTESSNDASIEDKLNTTSFNLNGRSDVQYLTSATSKEKLEGPTEPSNTLSSVDTITTPNSLETHQLGVITTQDTAQGLGTHGSTTEVGFDTGGEFIITQNSLENLLVPGEAHDNVEEIPNDKQYMFNYIPKKEEDGFNSKPKQEEDAFHSKPPKEEDGFHSKPKQREDEFPSKPKQEEDHVIKKEILRDNQTEKDKLEEELKGDLSCIRGVFVPAPPVGNAEIKYTRTQSSVEAEYECGQAHRLEPSGTASLVCRNRTWLGSLPNCQPLFLTNSSVCESKPCEQSCHESAGRAVCSCYSGFRKDGTTCRDINECAVSNGGCEFSCLNTVGAYTCMCPPGLRLSVSGNTCLDINECLLRNGHGPCQDTCSNLHGSYSCSCSGLPGTRLEADGHHCEDVDECRAGTAGCSHQCLNTLGRVFCLCPVGLQLGQDWKTCHDVDECLHTELQKEPCLDVCINTPGSYLCLPATTPVPVLCGHGFRLNQDGVCEDVDECSDGLARCSQLCRNLIGSYMCSCLPGFALDINGRICIEAAMAAVCPPLDPPPLGYLHCYRQPITATPRGRHRVVNHAGTVCLLHCPLGHMLQGRYRKTCTQSGQWAGPYNGTCLPRKAT